MPLVTVGSITVEYQLGLVKDGAIQHLAGYLPGDDDSPIPTIFKDLQPGSKVNKSGLNLTAFPVVPNGTLPQKFANGRVKLHLCTTETCTAGKTGAVHLGEWAYREEGEEVDGGPLLRLLVAANVKGTVLPKSPVPDPKSKAKAVQFEMDGQSPATPKTTPAGPITSWCNTSGIPEVAEALAFNGVRAVDEVALMTDAQIETLCKPLNLGSELRMKKAVKKLREKDAPPAQPVPESGSGWVDVSTGRELPLSAMRGAANGGPEVLMAKDKGVAFVNLAGRDWIQVRKLAGHSQVPAPDEHATFSAGLMHPGAAVETSTGSGFGRAGPLQELTAGCRELLSQVGGSKAVDANLAASFEQPADLRHEMLPTRTPEGMAPAMRQFAAESVPLTAGGRLLCGAGARRPAKPVPLSVPSLQAAAIAEEWTDDGKMTFKTSVRTAPWKKTENKDTAEMLARHLDIAHASGIVLAEEAQAEVQLRDLAALWFADQHPKDQETADHLRESSARRWGVPADMWKEAREFRKLSAGIKSD